VLRAETITLDGLTVTAPTDMNVSWQVIADAEGNTDVLRVTATVPEPSALAILLTGGLLILRRRR